MPARIQVILGRQFNSTNQRVNTAKKKQIKYRLRIAVLLAMGVTFRKDLEKIHGCLNYVADVEPFGRPFLAPLTKAISGIEENTPIILPYMTRLSLEI